MRLVLLLLLLMSFPARAFPLAEVEALQFPAWLERNGGRSPLRPGLELKPGDRLHVGDGARTWLRLSDGSRVKLGEKADFRIDELALVEAPKAANGQAADLARQRWGVAHAGKAPPLLTAALDVLKGTFRFTTGTLGKTGRREVRIKVGAATAGIRGTDLWGRSDEEKDLICLIDGQIVVQYGSKLLSLQDPLSFVEVPRGQPPRPVAAASREQVEKWARETELETGSGVGKVGGEWKVNLFSSPDLAVATETRRRVEENGYPVTVMPVTVKGTAYHRLRIENLADRAEAQALAAKLKGRYGIGEPWVSRQ